MNVSVLGYCFDKEYRAGYLKWHSKPLNLIGLDMTVNHLALQLDDWIVHPFTKGLSSRNVKWLKEKVSLHCFGKPCRVVHIGQANYPLSFFVINSEQRDLKLWSSYAWFYSLGLYRNKKDCVSFTKEMLDLCMGIGPLHAQTPNTLLQELHNHGY